MFLPRIVLPFGVFRAALLDDAFRGRKRAMNRGPPNKGVSFGDEVQGVLPSALGQAVGQGGGETDPVSTVKN